MNWSAYSRTVGNIFGAPLAMEGLFAFFLAANSWMQHPVGYTRNGKTGLPQLRAREVFTRSARLSLVVLVPAILFAMLVGSELGVIEARYQPMKIAAAEAQWTTCQPCSFSVFQIGGGNNDQTPTQILAIPHLLSLLATNHWNGKVISLTPLQAQYSKKYGKGYYVPNVFIQYWSMRVMAYTATGTSRAPAGSGPASATFAATDSGITGTPTTDSAGPRAPRYRFHLPHRGKDRTQGDRVTDQ